MAQNPTTPPPTRPTGPTTAQQTSNPTSPTAGNPTSPTAGSSSGSGSGPSPIPQTAPVGGLTMLTPAQMSTSFFKIQQDQPITFVWNFTSLYRQPEHLTLNVVGADNNNFPVGPTDGIIPGTQTSIVWDPYAYNQAHRATPLVQQTYQLQIWDDKGSNAPIAPGLFAMNTQVKFALYSPAPYTPLASGWECSGCKSGALARATAHPAFGALIATLVVCLLSGYGLLRRHML